jgi:radical SAM superfamily enzyme
MIIPIFLMNQGCRHRCLFCNERLTAGNRPAAVTADSFTRLVLACLSSQRTRRAPVQIAFYGGTFTGLPLHEQKRLLTLATPFLREGSVQGIRISTRPDLLDGDTLDRLKAGGVTTVELGGQSLDDDVLAASGRGHSAGDTLRAHALLRARGFATGLHLMVGLPGDSAQRFSQTVDGTIGLRPDTVRLHPTLVLRDTGLAEAFRTGRYRPLTLAEAISLCKGALKAFTRAGIPVIRLGLQTTPELEAPGAVVAGPFHPAFRSLVVAELFVEMARALLVEAGWLDGDTAAGSAGNPPGATRTASSANVPRGREAVFTVSGADLADFRGPQGRNLAVLEGLLGGSPLRVIADSALPRQTLLLAAGSRRLRTDWSGRIAAAPREDLHAGDGCDRETAPFSCGGGDV